MPLKDPSDVQTTSREEMICPSCYTEGLEVHEAFADDYSGKAEILKATKCPNEDCRYHNGFPVEVIEQQYHSQSFASKLASTFSGGDGGLNIGNVIIYGIIFIGLLVMGASAMGVDVASLFNGGGGQGAINGYVVNASGEPVEGAIVTIEGTNLSTTTGPNGRFTLSNVSYGKRTVVAKSSSTNTGIVEQPVLFSSKGLQPYGNVSKATTVQSGMVGLQLVNVNQNIRQTTLSGGQNVTFSFVSPKNLGDGMEVTIFPLNTSETTDSKTVQMGSNTVTVPEGTLIESKLSVTGTVTTKQFENTYNYRGTGQSVQVYGNLKPKNVQVTLESGASTPTFTRTENVSDGETVTIDVSGSGTVGDVQVVLSGGQATAPNSRDGVYSGENPSVSIDSKSAPSTIEVTLKGSVTAEDKTVTGTLSNSDSLAHDFAGNIPAKNVKITFTGGEPVDGTVADQTIEASGNGGTVTKQRTLIQDADASEYTLKLDYTVIQNSSLVSAGYTVEGVRTKIEPGTKNVTINAQEGDIIALWVEAKQESVPTSSYTHSGYFEVQKTEVSKDSVEQGGSIGVRATFKNPSSQTRTETIRLFKDGNQIQTARLTIAAGSTVTHTFNRVSFSSEGVHSIEVNDAKPVKIQVGDASLSYGEGRISGELIKTGTGGEVLFDTNGDGSYDCQVPAEGGTCTLGQVPSGTQSFVYTQKGVQNTNYELSYTSRTGAKGVSVDINGDGTSDISHPGVLSDGETVTGSATVDAGTHTIDFNVQNGGNVPYTLKWTEAGVVNQPTVLVNGEVVIDESESFKGSRSYNISSLSNGENTFTFRSGSGDPYIAKIIWSEQSSNTVPRLVVNGDVACSESNLAEDSSCTVPSSALQTGANEFVFEGGAEKFTYSVSQTARATPEQITATVNGEELVITRAEAVSSDATGSWTATRRLQSLTTGKNVVNLSTAKVNGMSTSASGTVTYTYEIAQAKNPRVVVYNNSSRTSFAVPKSALSSSGELQKNATVTIPPKVFSTGINKLTVASENNGGVRVKIVSINETVEKPIKTLNISSSNTSEEG